MRRADPRILARVVDPGRERGRCFAIPAARRNPAGFMTRPPRSILYVPAGRRELLEKAGRAGADLVIVDLEDGVAPDEKDTARENVRAAVASRILGGERPWMLRINAGRSGPHPGDLTVVGYARPPWVVVPKVEDPGTAGALASRFAEHGAMTALMIETAAGVLAAPSLAAAHPKIAMLIVGSADLRVSLGARPDPHRTWERHALAQVILSARAAGIAAIDSVYFAFKDDAGLRRHAAIGRELGFDGKSCIHPSQIPVVHEVYAPTPDEVAWARRVVAAWERGNGAANGVVAMDGEMVEALHVALAERILGMKTS